MAREFLRITPESTWGTYNSSGTHTIVQLDQNNAFTMRPKPIFWSIRTSGGYNRRWQKGSAKTGVAGHLNILVYGSQATALGSWINPTGSPLNLTSMTIDHVLVSENASSDKFYRRYLGALVQQADFTASENDQLMRCALQLVAQKPETITGSDFPEPAASAYPADAPYVLEHASGALTINDGTNTSARTGFERFKCIVNNMIDTRFFESQYLSAYRWCGRDVDWKTKLKYQYAFDRSDYEALTTVTANITFTNGAHTLVFDFKTAGLYDSVDDDLALDKVFLQELGMNAYFDVSNTTDFALTAT